MVIAGLTMMTNFAIACLVGLFAFAYFQQIGCDPLAGKMISNSNQVSLARTAFKASSDFMGSTNFIRLKQSSFQ